MADEPHAEAILALLDAHPSLVVYSEEIPENPPTAYVKVYIHLRRPDSDNMRFKPTEKHCWVHTYSVGQTAAGARLIAGFVETQLLGVKPVVAGRTRWPIYWQDGNPPSRDETLGYPVITQLDVWCFKTDAA